MDRLIKTLITVVLSTVVCAQIQAQKNNGTALSVVPSENVYLHVNATSFVSGETLYYKLYSLNSLNSKLSDLSKIAYVELIDNDKKIIFSHKLVLENGTSQGDYFISSNIKTGTYKLVAFTKWMLNNQKTSFFETEITIINPFENEEENKISTRSIEEKNTVNSTETNIQLNKKNFTQREKISLKLDQLQKGNYSISVRKKQDLPTIEKQNLIEYLKNQPSETIAITSSNTIIPEIRGQIITGRITPKDASFPINNISVGMSMPGKNFEFKLVKTDKNGKFMFNIDKPHQESNFVFQIVNDFKENYSLEIEKNNGIDPSKLNFDTNLVAINSNLKTVLEEHSVASQIENSYFEKKSDSILSTKRYPALYEPIAKEYILDNYTRFKTIKETIIEVVKEMQYYKNNDTYTFYIADYDAFTELTEQPLVLVDGVLVQNINDFLEYDATNIYKICLIQGGYYYGNRLFNGLISFITKNYDYQLKTKGNYTLETNIAPTLPKKTYYNPDYSVATNSNRIPDYRYQLLWNPDLKLDSENTVSFYTSDKTGTFEIHIEGFTNEGTPITMKQSFEVN